MDSSIRGRRVSSTRAWAKAGSGHHCFPDTRAGASDEAYAISVYRSLIALTLLLFAAIASAAESISVVEFRSIAPATAARAPEASHALKLYAYAFSGTRWTLTEIVEAVAQSAELLAQCRIGLDAGELRIVEAPRRFHFYSTLVSRALLRALDVPKPAIFFVEDTHNRPAFDAEAIGLTNARSRPELANTVWVAHGARDLPFAIAHELVHVLSDSGEHTDEPENLMREQTSPANSRLSVRQCARVRSRGEANGLLRPR